MTGAACAMTGSIKTIRQCDPSEKYPNLPHGGALTAARILMEQTLKMNDMDSTKDLTKTKILADKTQIPVDQDWSSRQMSPDEIDLVDVFGFFWKWRTFFIGSACVGLAVANILHFAVKKTIPAHVTTGSWDLTFQISSATTNTPPANIMPLITMLQTPLGAKEFKTSLLSLLPPDAQESLTQWHTQWVANPGKPQFLETTDSGFTIHAEGPQSLPFTEIAGSLEQGFQSLLATYTRHLALPFQSLIDKKTEILQSLGTLSFEAYRDFLNDPQYPQDLKKDMVGGLLKGSNAPLSLEHYVLILGSSSQDKELIHQKIQKFQSVSADFDSIQAQVQQLIKTYPPTGPLPLEGSFKLSSSSFIPSAAKDGKISPLVKYNVVGLFLALMLAFIGAIFWQFYQTNKTRIQQITHNNKQQHT